MSELIKKVTTRESVRLFRLAVENAVQLQAHTHAYIEIGGRDHGFKLTEENKEEFIRKFNAATCRYMRDHCRALSSHYHDLLEKILEDPDTSNVAQVGASAHPDQSRGSLSQ